MEDAQINNENTPRLNVLQNEKRKPLESPFSAFSPAQRLAKKKGRVLCEPGDSNLEASMMDDSVLHTEDSDSFRMLKPLQPKVLFGEGDSETLADLLSGDCTLDRSIVEATQTDGDRTFSVETRPFVPDSIDPNLDETYAEMSMNQTFSNIVRPSVPSLVDPNLDETLADMTLSETLSNVVLPIVPSAVDPNLDETLAETTINQTQLSMGDDTLLNGGEDSLEDDADRTLEDGVNKSIERIDKKGAAFCIFDELNEQNGDDILDGGNSKIMENGEGVDISNEMNTVQLTVPVDITVKEEEEKSIVEASQENSLMREGGISLMEELKEGVSLFDELNTQSEGEFCNESIVEMSMNENELKSGEEAASLFDEMNEGSPMDESDLSTKTAIGLSERRQFYSIMRQRLSQINTSIAPTTPQKEKEVDSSLPLDDYTPTRSTVALASPGSDVLSSHRLSGWDAHMASPGTPSKSSSRFNMNESQLSFILLEAECTNSVYVELKNDMQRLQEELSQSREMTEKVERERENAKKEAADYMFMMETTKKRMMNEKMNLSKQIIDLENELNEARRMSNVVEEEGRKVELLEMMKKEIEEQKKELEEKMNEESENYTVEKERMNRRVEEMEKTIEEERKKANEEMERRLMECRGDMERKLNEILNQKNELINQLEKMECESGEKENINEENERKLEGEKAMMERMMNDLMIEKKEIEDELERVKKEKEDQDGQMAKLTVEFEGMKNVIVEVDQLRNAAFEESRIANELNEEVEKLRRSNDEMKREMEEKDKELESLRSCLTATNGNDDRWREMNEELKMKNEEMRRVMNEKEQELMSLRPFLSESSINDERMREMNGQIEELKKLNESTTKEMMSLHNDVTESEGRYRDINDQMEELKRINEEITRGMEQKEEELVSLRSSLSTNGERMKEMEEKMKALENEKIGLELTVKGVQMETEMVGKVESRMEEMMNGWMKKTEVHFKETSSLKDEIIELKRKIMEADVQMKDKERDVESTEERRKIMEREMERMKEEMKLKMESMESVHTSMKNEMDSTMNALAAARESNTIYEHRMASMEEDMKKRIEEIERDKDEKVNEITMEMERMKMEITGLTDGKMKMEDELERKNGEMEMVMREMENEKEKASTVNQCNDEMREMMKKMEEAGERIVKMESMLNVVNGEKEEMERRMMEENGLIEEMKKEKEEMRETMNMMKRELEMEKSAHYNESNETIKNIKMELENEMREKEMITNRLNEVENEKMNAMKIIEEERERNDILSASIKQLENELDHKATVTTVSTGFDEGEKKKLMKELEEERGTVMRLKKEVKRLEDTCDEFDDIEWKLKEALVEKQKKIDALEGKTNMGGPALLDALKPTMNEIKAMDETVVDSKQSSSSTPREFAGKEEKEDEEMKEYGTPSGSIIEEDDRKMEETIGGDVTLGVTKIDATRYDDDDEYEETNKTRPNASCRQS